MNKLILTTALLVVAVFTVAYLYFTNISVLSRNNDKALSIIPNDAAILFQFKNDKGIYDLFSDFEVFNAITGEQKQVEHTALKALLSQLNPLSERLEGQNIFLSFHPDKDSVLFFWVMPLPAELTSAGITDALSDNPNLRISMDTLNKTEILKAEIRSIKRLFYLHVEDGVLSGSFSRKALQKSLDPEQAKLSKEFIKEINVENQQNQNSPANVFVNFKSSVPFISSFFKQKLNGNFSILNNLNAYATLNMNFKSDALMFNGLTQTDTAQKNYVNLFLNQRPVKNPIKRLVPANTANFISYGLSNYQTFHRDLQGLLNNRQQLKKINSTLNQISEETGIKPDRDIRKYWANEFIVFQLSTQERFGAIQLSNGRQMQFFMEPISTDYSDNIRYLKYPDLLYYYFGDAFRNFPKPFFSIVDNQMIISNSARSLQRFLTTYSKNPLYPKENFANFNQFVADQSNISIFIHIKNSGSNITSELKPAYAANLKSNAYGLRDFYGVSYQWSSNNDHFFTNFYAGYPPARKDTTVTFELERSN